MKCTSAAADCEQLQTRVKEGMALLALVYSTDGISPPRKGRGAVKLQEPLVYTAFYVDAGALSLPCVKTVELRIDGQWALLCSVC